MEALQITTSEIALESIHHQHQYHLRQQDYLQHKLDRQEQLEYNKTVTPVIRRNQGTQTDVQVNDEAILHAMSDTDSVLGFMVNRNRTISDPRSQDFSVRYSAEKPCKITKVPRDNKDIEEEMYVKTQELEKQVLQLSKEVANLKSENKLLHENMTLVRSAGKGMFDMADESCIPDLMLPPLEMPQFDLESLKGNISTGTENLTLFDND